MKAFSPTYRVVSVTYPPVDKLADLGKGVMAILDKEKIDSVVVVGSSLGGYLTQYLLSTYPKRVEKVVLGNTFPKNDLYEEQNHGRVAMASWLPEWVVMGALRQNLVNVVVPASRERSTGKGSVARKYLRAHVEKNSFWLGITA